MNTLTLLLAYTLFSILPLQACAPERSAQQENSEERLQWWSQARFGMFIHWGLYALPAGEWKGHQTEEYSEWLMYWEQIPVADYEKLAPSFNPEYFNADEWVKTAKIAGMKYIVITAKHHDGFSMFDSKVTRYDIVDATPFGRDPMKELAEACRREGIKLCFYYSVDRDWHHPDAQGNHLKQSNFWDYPEEDQKDFDKYFDEFVLPQLTELLTNYGPVGIMWFDGIGKKTAEQNERIIKLVHDLQPDCLINSRLGDWETYEWGDYRSMDDNVASDRDLGYGWENPGTLNYTFGYSKFDDGWKGLSEILEMLCGIASNGGNYLLNVGPMADGRIQPEAVSMLTEIGDWMQINSESIYNTQSCTLNQPEWGRFTCTEEELYVHIFEWPGGSLHIHSLGSKDPVEYEISEVRMLGMEEKLAWNQEDDYLSITLPEEKLGKYVQVLRISITPR